MKNAIYLYFFFSLLPFVRWIPRATSFSFYLFFFLTPRCPSITLQRFLFFFFLFLFLLISFFFWSFFLSFFFNLFSSRNANKTQYHTHAISKRKKNVASRQIYFFFTHTSKNKIKIINSRNKFDIEKITISIFEFKKNN